MAKPPIHSNPSSDNENDINNDDDNTPAPSPNTPAAKRKASNPNTTPRRINNNPRKPSGPRTPLRKTSAQNGNAAQKTTPASAPARPPRKVEPTLLGDFLLGRPSPARQRTARRKSLDAVKREMRAEVVARVQAPGKVKERVKEWQKASAGAGKGEGAEEIVVDYETDSEVEVVVQEKEKLVVPKRHTPAKRKEKARDGGGDEEEGDKGDADRARSKNLAPKKRVISDGHWRTKKSPPRKGGNIPKNFLQATAVNPPVEKKIEDWVRRTESVEPEIVLEKPKPRSRSRKAEEWEQQEESPRSRKASRQGTESPRSRNVSKQEPFDDGIRIRPSRSTSRDEGTRIKPSKDRPTKENRKSSNSMERSSRASASNDDVTRVSASKPSSNDDGIRIRPSRESSPQSELRVKPVRKDGSKRRPKSENESPTPTPRKKSNQHLMPPSESEGRSRVTSHATTQQDEEDNYSYVTPTRQGSRGQGRKSLTPPESMDEIPFGNSAFSVLELPVGAEAGTMRRPVPKRNPSFAAVPKVLKRVYTEGKKMMHDTVEPPRGGTNQPPSIDSWLNGTVDPFVESSAPEVEGLEVPEAPVSRMRSYKEEDRTEKDLERDVEHTEPRRKRRNRKSLEKDDPQPEPLPVEHKNRDTLPSMENSPPISPSGLRRSPATRNTSSPKSARKLSLKEAVFDAFKGESSIGKSASSPFDFIGMREKDVNRVEEYRPRDLESVPEDPPPRHSPRNLVSMLSLPDAEVPGRGHSIKSARSIRTTRTNLDTATVQDLMKELAEDETKYTRELNTLVDGVIPVLLTCVLSKSDSAIAAGLFDPRGEDNSFTKPIVDMGVALERLKSLHKRIPLASQDEFLHWAQSACKTYEDYLRAWRSGFEDVVVNLAPASRTSSLAENSDPDKMRINKHGDVLRDTGERADVGYMLKRPLGLEKLLQTKASKDVTDAYEELEKYRRQRIRAEVARKEDQRANNTDASRARDPKTMSHTKDVTINRDRQVYMKDIFSFEMIHSNGQHLECEIELTLRVNESNTADTGDVLICQTDGTKYFLLFPPVSLDYISARKGDSETELVLMIRGKDGTRSEWRESFMIDAKEVEVATEWLEKLGTSPVPPPIIHYKSKLDPELETVLSEAGDDTRSIVGALKSSSKTDDIPLGERPRREAEEAVSGGVPGLMHIVYKTFSEDRISELGEHGVLDVKDLNDAMSKAGKKPLVQQKSRPTTPQRPRPSRYHGKNVEVCTVPCVMSGALDGDDKAEIIDTKDNEKVAAMTLGDVPKLRSPRQEKTSSPLRESMRPEPESMKRYHKTTPTRTEDTPPPPPVHRTPSTPSLKSPPPLDSPTPRGRNRRTSSPLKHEYQPSDASGTSSSSEQSDSDSYSESSEESADELDELDSDESRPTTAATLPVSRPASIYNHPNGSLAPSNSASQTPFISRPAAPRPSTATKRIAAMVSLWSDKKGRWEDIYPDPCSVIVGPGRVECFDLSSVHSSPVMGSDVDSPKKHNRDSDPLVGQDITPHVNLRQSTRIDIEITAPPSASSRMKGVALTLRYRTLNQQDCDALYAALHKARMENLKFKMMEQQRMFASYGQNNAYEKAVAGSRHDFLLRKHSFRRSEANAPPQSTTGSEQSSLSSAISAVKRFGIGGIFNISRSSVQAGQGGMSTSSSDYSGATPPHTTSPSIAASGSMFSNGITVRDLGWQDLKIRLYIGLPGNKWDDRGGARLTVTAPPPGMRQASALDHGPEKRITITHKASDEADPKIILDCVLGAKCFSKLGQRGVVASIWEDIVGDDGTVGAMRATGGVSGKMRKWCFQTARAGDCEWIYMLCRSGMA
ncbi:hypothetical protein BKA61DRAFT_495027 [Leptodontidium sp. MPI-SDFR-AT-0119]|nr:hypothetical protein BKA61DRAFT_495027 [Leptodontidium sp. MPI-SDFR-AT-0119]